MQDNDQIIDEVTSSDYKYGFTTDIDTETIGKGLSEETVRLISAKKEEPEWLLEFRLEAFRHWQTLEQPDWALLKIPPIDYQDIIYYAAPKKKQGPKSLDEVDPELLRTFEKLGIPLEEQKILSGIAVDAVMDSVSVKTTFRETLAEKGIIFCSFSEAVREYPDLVKKYLGAVVPYTDNYFAALNSAVFSDGSFVYIPKWSSPRTSVSMRSTRGSLSVRSSSPTRVLTSPTWRAVPLPSVTRTSFTPLSSRSSSSRMPR